MSEQEDRDKRLAEMQAQLDAAQAEQTEVAEQASTAGVDLGRFDGSTALPTERKASEATPEEIERARIIRDPWAGKNALQILRHPPGKRLQWINPQARAQRGMRGWTVVNLDDAIGREIHLYVNDPPSRQEGMADTGNVVRRGDVVLAWIDEGIYDSRILKGRQKAQRNLRNSAGGGQRQYGQHGQSTGEGLADDADPRYRMKPARGMVSPRRLEEYRQNARGTHEDPRITVEGRRLFDS